MNDIVIDIVNDIVIDILNDIIKFRLKIGQEKYLLSILFRKRILGLIN